MNKSVAIYTSHSAEKPADIIAFGSHLQAGATDPEVVGMLEGQGYEVTPLPNSRIVVQPPMETEHIQELGHRLGSLASQDVGDHIAVFYDQRDVQSTASAIQWHENPRFQNRIATW